MPKMQKTEIPAVGLVMGSKSDWETVKHCAEVLDAFNISYEAKVISAHRTPDEMFQYAESARSRGLRLIIAAAGGAAHLPGMVAAKTTLPVLGIPIKSKNLNGLDSLLSIVQMPKGVPVGTLAIGDAGAANAAYLAAAILGSFDEKVADQIENFRRKQKEEVLSNSELKL